MMNVTQKHQFDRRFEASDIVPNDPERCLGRKSDQTANKEYRVK